MSQWWGLGRMMAAMVRRVVDRRDGAMMWRWLASGKRSMESSSSARFVDECLRGGNAGLARAAGPSMMMVGPQLICLVTQRHHGAACSPAFRDRHRRAVAMGAGDNGRKGMEKLTLLNTVLHSRRGRKKNESSHNYEC
jgi:hypothetical protein